MLKKKRNMRKGVIAYFFIFIFLSVVVVMLFAFTIPLLIDINTHFYTAGERALDDAVSWSEKINDTDIKAQIQDTLASSKASIPDQIEILGFFHRYGWLILIVAVLFVIFMQTRVTVETATGFIR